MTECISRVYKLPAAKPQVNFFKMTTFCFLVSMTPTKDLQKTLKGKIAYNERALHYNVVDKARTF
jgi:hypothetical protein